MRGQRRFAPLYGKQGDGADAGDGPGGGSNSSGGNSEGQGTSGIGDSTGLGAQGTGQATNANTGPSSDMFGLGRYGDTVMGSFSEAPTPNSQNQEGQHLSGIADDSLYGMGPLAKADPYSGLKSMFKSIAMGFLGVPVGLQMAVGMLMDGPEAVKGKLSGALGGMVSNLAGLSGLPGALAGMGLGKLAKGYMGSKPGDTVGSDQGDSMMAALASRAPSSAPSANTLSPQARSLMNVPTFGYQQTPIIPPVQQTQSMFTTPTFGYQQQLPRSTDTWA